MEQNQDAMSRRLATATENGVSNREFDDLRNRISGMDGKLMGVNQDLSNLKSSLDRQVNDLMQINNEMKSRPVVDPSKIANSTQQMDNKVRDLHGQMMQLKQQLEREQSDRERGDRQTQETINRLQEIIRDQDKQKNDILKNIVQKGDTDKAKLNEEAKRLNDKIHLITNEVTKAMNDSQQKLRDDMTHKYNALDAALRNEIDARSLLETDMKRRMDGGIKANADQIEALAKAHQAERNKNKERFQKVNEALAALEKHLDLGNKKMDKIMNAEIQNRKLHEKGLLSKVTEIESKLNTYMGGMEKALNDVEAGKENVKMPTLDTDALRREMEAIAADKNKLSMEGLLKLEEKMSGVQQMLHRDKRDMTEKVAGMADTDQYRKLKAQIDKLDEINQEMEETQDRIRDKVEKQIPQDLNELAAKADNIKHQLNSRIDKEEEERFLAIKELQEAYAKLQTGQPATAGKSKVDDKEALTLRRDVDECKVAVKKLAESVTTVKNVLDKKITDEGKRREADIQRIDTQLRK